MEENIIETNGGVPARIGKKFHTEIERIKVVTNCPAKS